MRKMGKMRKIRCRYTGSYDLLGGPLSLEIPLHYFPEVVIYSTYSFKMSNKYVTIIYFLSCICMCTGAT